MTTIIRATCPGCNTKIDLQDSAEPIVDVVCPTCNRHFKARTRKDQAASSNAQRRPGTSAINDMPIDPFAGLPDMNQTPINNHVDWSAYGTRKPIIALKPLLIATGSVLSAALVILLVLWIRNLTRDVDVASAGAAIFRGPADNPDRLFADWKRYRGEQSLLLGEIVRRTDCESRIFPMEQLRERYIELVGRAALVESTLAPTYAAKSLPPRPTSQDNSGRNFRAQAAVLTADFLEAEERTEAVSNVLLLYFHAALDVLPPPANDDENIQAERIALKRMLNRHLASFRRGADENETSVLIYELVESLKKLRDAHPGVRQAKQPVYAEHEALADAMRAVLAAGRADTTDTTVGKSLAAFEQLLR